ncbi:MAG TPA: hypothetical protein VM537_22040 [Anaerolineae bacterium]|nr:hypothetical protein [Anaerolineae bacterium]
MRTATAGELAALANRDRKELFRIWVENATGTLVDLSSWFTAFTVTANVNFVAATGSITFWRETADGSLAPLMADPMPISSARTIVIEWAVIGQGDSVVEGDWHELLRGEIDDVAWGGRDPQMTTPIRDLSGLLLDTWIQTRATYGNNTSPVAQETVMQQILDATLGAAVVTMVTVGDPDFGILYYEQNRSSLADALSVHSDLIGWDLRYVWDETAEEWQLKYFEPDRDKTTVDHTFGPYDYLDLSEVARGRRGVRNRVEVAYEAGEPDLSYVADDEDSQAEFGVRYMMIDVVNNNQITTLAAATVLGDAILKDTAQPHLTHTSVNAFWPLVELGDMYRFEPNGVHYNTAQDIAIVGFTHNVTADPGSPNTTTLQGRSKPSGSTTRWLTRGERARVTEVAVEFEDPGDDVLTVEDLQVLLTVNSGTTGYSTAQPDANDSLGGYISTTFVPAGLSGLFRDVTDQERIDGIVRYRTVAFANLNDSPVPQDWACVYGYLTSLGEDGATWAAGLDPEGVVVLDRANIQSAVCADEETAPDGVTFYAPDAIDHADVFNPGTIPPGSGFVVTVRQTIAAGATPQITDSILYFTDTVPV